MRMDLTQAECEEVLGSHYYAHLGCVENDQPFVFPITYLYLEGYFYGYTQEGKKVEIMRKNPNICIQVEQVNGGLVEWKSVMCWGFFEEIIDPEEIQSIRLLLADQHGKILVEQGKMEISPMVKIMQERPDEEIKSSVVYRMKPVRITGKGETH